jgi:hypothetical protein
MQILRWCVIIGALVWGEVSYSDAEMKVKILQPGVFTENVSTLQEQAILKIRASFEEFGGGMTEEDFSFASIAEIRRLDVNNDNKEDLAVLINWTCSADPIELMLICHVQKDVVAYLFSTQRASMNDTLRDVNGDHLFEVFINSTFPERIALFNAIFWIDVYSWENNTYQQNNAKFLDSFYIPLYFPYIAIHLANATKELSSEQRREFVTTMLQESQHALEQIANLLSIEQQQRQNAIALKQSPSPEELLSISIQLGNLQKMLQQGRDISHIRSGIQQQEKMLNELAISAQSQ